MATIVTRSGKGSPLTNTEVDANFSNLNADKAELDGAAFTGAITTNSTIDGRDVAADGVTADAALPKAGGAMTGAITTNSTFDGVDVGARDAVLTSTTTTANAALPKAGGAVTGAITTNSTFDGVDVGARDSVLSSTTTAANAALPKAGGAMTGAITTNSTFDGRDVAADGVTADAALPKAGGAMTGAITTNSTFDGVDVGTRDAVLTSTTTTANAALPKSGGTMTGALIVNETSAVTMSKGTTGQRPSGVSGMFRYNTTEDKFEGYSTEWGEIGGGAADLRVNSFTGNGSTTAYTLSSSPDLSNTLAYIDGVYQVKAAYSMSGQTLTFSAAPDNGSLIEITAATVAPVQESTDFLLNQFSGNGSTTAFSLSAAPTTENQCSVFISGVYQSKSNFSVSGSTLTFSTAPPSGSAIEVMAARTVVFSAGTPDDGTVTTAKIANGAVTAVKLADDAVTTDKLANNVVINTSGAITGAAGSFTTLSASGEITANAGVVVDTITIDGSEIDQSSGNLTLDVAGDIILDTGANIQLQATGTEFGRLFQSSADLYIYNPVSDKDIVIYGNDGGSAFEALRFDMSAAGAATFNAGATFGSAVTVEGPLAIRNATQSFFGGLSAEVNSGIINLGVNEGSGNRFGGAYTQANQGGMLHFDTRAGNPLFQIYGRTAGTANASGSILLEIESSGLLSQDGGAVFNELGADADFRVESDGNANMLFVDGGTNRVGVGTASPSSGLHIVGADNTASKLTFTNTAPDPDNVWTVYPEYNSQHFWITSSGGGTAKFGNKIQATRSGGECLVLNRQSNDGDIAVFRKDGTTVGTISSRGGVHIQIQSGGNTAGLHFGGSEINPVKNQSISDNTIDLGQSSYRFDDIYATNGTIQTSDRNEKQDIEELSEAEQRIAVACKGLLRKFRWKDSVAEKGDEARTHFGIIAQDLQAAFAAEGLDAGDYAMFISTTWTDEETNEEKTRMGVRYSELLAFIISAI